MAEGQVFSEKEVSEIMQRAAELQDREQAGYSPGVTRDELLRIAGEMGVSEEVLLRAIDEQGDRKEKRPFHLAREEERVVDGEVDPNDFDLVLKHIKPRQNQRDAPVQVGKTLQASTVVGGSIQKVEVTSRKGRTQIRVRHYPFFPIFATLYPAFLGTLFSTALAAHGMVAASVGVATGLFGTALVVMRGWLNRGNRGTTELADRLQTAIAEDLAAKGSAPSSVAETKEIQQRIGEE